MLTLNQLVETVNNAALVAADTVRAKNLAIIEDFFELADGKDPSIAAAIAALDAAAEDMDDGVELDNIRKSRQRLVAMDGGDTTQMPPGISPLMRPKMVAVAYPKESIDGPGSHIVYVPLIALTPMSTASLSNLTFKTDLELSQSDSGELLIAFPVAEHKSIKQTNNNDEQSRAAHASLEISLDASATPQGLKKLIEGYERSLRAQIPG